MYYRYVLLLCIQREVQRDGCSSATRVLPDHPEMIFRELPRFWKRVAVAEPEPFVVNNDLFLLLFNRRL